MHITYYGMELSHCLLGLVWLPLHIQLQFPSVPG